MVGSAVLNTSSVFEFSAWLREAEGLYTSIGHVDLYSESYLNTLTAFSNKHLSPKPHLHGKVLIMGAVL